MTDEQKDYLISLDMNLEALEASINKSPLDSWPATVLVGQITTARKAIRMVANSQYEEPETIFPGDSKHSKLRRAFSQLHRNIDSIAPPEELKGKLRGVVNAGILLINIDENDKEGD